MSGGHCRRVVERQAKRNAAPRFGRRSAQMRPPWSWTIARQMARPRPTPPSALSGAPRWNFSKMRSTSPCGSPGPSSSTETTISPPSTYARRRTGVRAAVYWRRSPAGWRAPARSARRRRARAAGLAAGRPSPGMVAARRSRRRASAEPTISASAHRPIQRRSGRSRAASSAAPWPPRSDMSRDCSNMLSASPLALSPRSARRLDQAGRGAAITASGVRRSCEIEASSDADALGLGLDRELGLPRACRGHGVAA